MGNSITKQPDSISGDKRLGDTLLAKEIYNILKEQTADYNGTPIKVNVAKACSMGAIAKDIDLSRTKIVSVAFPKPLTPNDDDGCKEDGVCLGVDYVGFQMNEDPKDYCTYFNDVENKDNFMLDYCAKSMYDQGCLSVVQIKQKDGDLKNVGKITPNKENKTCWEYGTSKFNYGPPECACLNSVVGRNLNNNPSKEISQKSKHPYPYLSQTELSSDNTFSKYSLNIFYAKDNEQYPKSLDSRCSI